MLSFSYEVDDKPVLMDINLDVKSGETIAFVGMSGEGKSTLISLIPRFYDVSEGRIIVDGQGYRGLKVRTLRDKIGHGTPR